MEDLENGYVEVDTERGTAHFVSYKSLGSGLFMIVLMVFVTIFIKSANDFLINNKWIIIIPTLIEVLVRTLIFEQNTSLGKRIAYIIGDAIKTFCMYCVWLALVDEVANSHWADRVFLVVLYSALLLAANWLISTALKYLRSFKLSIVYLIVCLVVSVGALCLYFNHAWYWQGYEYTTFLNTATIVKIDERMEGKIVLPRKIYNYTVESIDKDAFVYNSKVTHVELPDTLKVIKEDAFSRAYSLKSVKIPKSVEKIERSLFSSTYKFEIYYEGSEQDWNKINIQDKNIKALKIHFNCN